MKLRHGLIAALVLSAMLLAGCGMSLPINLAGNSKDSGATDKDSLMKQAQIITDTVYAGFLSMYRSRIAMENAAGNSKAAAELEDIVNEVTKNPDRVEGATTLMSRMSDKQATEEDLKKIDYTKEEAKKQVKESSIHAVVAIGYDTYTAKNIDTFISMASKAISANPMGMLDLKPHLQLAQKAAPLIPEQISQMTSMVSHYSEYSKDKSITNVSQADIKKEQEKNNAKFPNAKIDEDFEGIKDPKQS